MAWKSDKVLELEKWKIARQERFLPYWTFAKASSLTFFFLQKSFFQKQITYDRFKRAVTDIKKNNKKQQQQKIHVQKLKLCYDQCSPLVIIAIVQ